MRRAAPVRDRWYILAGLAVVVGLLTWPAWRATAMHGASLRPAVPAARAGTTQCIRDTDWMRRNHMKLLMQVRDDVVHRGIRNTDETLPGCMNCHASRGADGRYVSATSPQFFCNSCHRYAGVTTDCFSCHSSRPATEEAVTARRTERESDAAAAAGSRS